MDKVDVNDDLKACKEYLDKAEEVLCKLEEDINSETWKFTVQMVGATTALAGIGGAGGKLIISSFWITNIYSDNFIDDVNIRLQCVKKFHSINGINQF